MMQTEEEKNTKVGFLRLLRMNQREWPYILLGILAAAANGVVMPLFAVILSSLIGALLPTEPASEIMRFCILFWCLGAGQFIASTVAVCSLNPPRVTSIHPLSPSCHKHAPCIPSMSQAYALNHPHVAKMRPELSPCHQNAP
jgi:hypothetical protein